MAKITIQDEEGQYLNRYEMTPVEGQTNTFDLVRKAALTKQGTPFNADTMGHYVQTEDLKAHVDNEEVHIRPGERDAWNGGLIITAVHTKTGTTHNLEIEPGAKNLTFLATADLVDGDSWTVNSQPVTAVLQNGEPLPGELFKSGCWVTGVYWDGTRLGFRSGAATVPSIFGNGSDGDAVISGTVTLPVPVPHQSIVEMQYKSLYINAGAILRAAAHNAGLIIRVKGDCTIHGTIDQSGLAPKTNPNNNYPYPAQLVCGDGGNGGSGKAGSNGKNGGIGGTGMLKRPYGGGYGGGAGSGGGQGSYLSGNGGTGGSSTGITTSTADIFKGGLGATAASQNGTDGILGGGAGGGKGGGSTGGNGGDGGTGGGSNGNSGTTVNNSSGGAGGGAGNYGGGVVLLYIGGRLEIDGAIKCNGLNGGAGGKTSLSPYGDGGDGGGGGGGAIYILHRGTYTSTGLLQVNGGTGGNAGGIGSITVIQYEEA